jgi:glycosyltransferase involved in cell wall biosynthesis
MDFTVLLPTRNRPVLLQRALASVLAQQVDGLEVLVIDDGTTDPFAAPLAAIEAASEARVRFLHLPPRARGHGQSYALNFGAAQASGRYLCFLDDDDEWTDPRYLACAAGLIDGPGPLADLLYFDQAAFANGRLVERTVWIEDLARVLAPAMRPAPDGAWRLTARDLLRAHGFCHLNTTIIRRDLFNEISGFDDAIRYECDRDFYLRAIDRAQTILYVPRTVSRHNIPDPTRRDNMSTLVSDIEKRVFQATLLEKATLFSRQEVVRAYAKRHHTHTLKHLATALYKSRRYRPARQYALEALPTGFNLAWLAFCCWLGLLAAFDLRRPEPVASQALGG